MTPQLLQNPATLLHATVTNITATAIELLDPQGQPFEADILFTSDDMPLTLAPGDKVLVHIAPDQTPLVLGRIGLSRSPHASPKDGPEDELVLEAKSNLTLKCGDGSITIRNDGKILLKGKNIVSVALETNRIKGGAVSIN